jgi:L-amino acid N-acyltransferase YncA
MTGATTRPAQPGDLAAIASIYAHYVTHSTATFELEPPDQDEWVARCNAIRRQGLPFLVAELDGVVAGYAYCARWRGNRPAYQGTVEDTVYVTPAATGRGVGSALLGTLLERCARAHAREVIAVITDSGGHGDSSSIRLHQRHGFDHAGRLRRVGVKHGRVLDTVLMQRGLAGATEAAPR